MSAQSPNWPQWLPLREDLRELSPYGAPQLDNVVRLNTNENPFSLPAHVVKEIASRIEKLAGDLNRYPDRDAVRPIFGQQMAVMKYCKHFS